MRKVLLVTAILAISVLGVSATTSAGYVNKTVGKTSVTAGKISEKTAEATALNFINIYYSNLRNQIDDSKWFEAQPLTNNFKKIYRNQEKAIKISEQILEGKKVSKADRRFVEKYSVDYSPIFGAAILDLETDSVFAVESYDKKTGIVTLKDEKTEIELPVKVVNVKGKWLIEGAGTVNISN